MTIASLICTLILVYTYILFIRIVLSWLTMVWSPPPSLGPAIRIIYDLTEPILGFMRRYIPPVGGFDLSPLIIFILLSMVRSQIC